MNVEIEDLDLVVMLEDLVGQGFTESELGKMMGVSQSTINGIKTQLHNQDLVRLGTAKKIVKFYNRFFGEGF